MMTRAVRGLLVSPWFAAGAGVVIAAGAFVYAPHARLEIMIPNKTLPCVVAGCPEPQGAAPPVPAGSGNGTVTASPAKSAAPSRPARRHAAGVTVSYTRLWNYGGRFSMLIKVRSKHPIGAWSLTFAIPGASHLWVVGAAWQSSWPDGGTASGPGGGSMQSSSGADGGFVWGSEQPNGDRGQPGWDGNTVMFMVQGNGAGVAPVGCVYNRASCQFSAG